MAKWLRWSARVMGALAALFYLSFFVGEGLLGPEGFFKSGIQGVSFKIGAGIVMLLVSSLGLLMAWRWERAGAWVALWALVGFAVVYPRGFPIWVLVAMAVPAILFLAAHKLTELRPRIGGLHPGAVSGSGGMLSRPGDHGGRDRAG
jgi:hypothetical protein